MLLQDVAVESAGIAPGASGIHLTVVAQVQTEEQAAVDLKQGHDAQEPTHEHAQVMPATAVTQHISGVSDCDTRQECECSMSSLTKALVVVTALRFQTSLTWNVLQLPCDLVRSQSSQGCGASQRDAL